MFPKMVIHMHKKLKKNKKLSKRGTSMLQNFYDLVYRATS